MKEVSKKLRKKMDQLLDKNFIRDFFDGNLRAFFENARKIIKIDKRIYKDVRGRHDYTLVMEFLLKIEAEGCFEKKSVFCKAHSNEKKNKSIYYMEALRKNGFDKGLYQVPRPLVYLPDLRVGFYEGVRGNNLLYYLKRKGKKKIKTIVKDAARWISKLHEVQDIHFNSFKLQTLRIRDNQPPIKQVLKEMKKNYKKLHDAFFPLYKETIKYEKKFLRDLKKSEKTKIIYADYHPENIIVQKGKREGITVIDFTDLAIGDPMRDVGTFMEQVSFMARKSDENHKQWPKIFLNEYIKVNNMNLSVRDCQRINLYRLWAALRNIIHFYYKCDPDQVIWHLVADAKKYLEKIKKRSTEI